MEKTIKIKIGEKKLDFMRAEGIVCDKCTYRERCCTIKSPLDNNKTFQEFCCELDYKSPNIIPISGTIEYNFKDLLTTEKKITSMTTSYRSLISTDAVYNQLKKWISRAKELGNSELVLDANLIMPTVYSVTGKDDTDTKVVLRIDLGVTMKLKGLGYDYVYHEGKLKIVW